MPAYRVSQALKIKNRLVKRLNETRRRIASQNVHDVDSSSEFDIEALWVQLREQSEQLAATKAAISLANRDIQKDIYTIAELRGLVTFLQGLSKGQPEVREYPFYPPASMPATKVKAEIGEAKAAAMIDALEAEIDEIQDRIDTFNATAQVELP